MNSAGLILLGLFLSFIGIYVFNDSFFMYILVLNGIMFNFLGFIYLAMEGMENENEC